MVVSGSNVMTDVNAFECMVHETCLEPVELIFAEYPERYDFTLVECGTSKRRDIIDRYLYRPGLCESSPLLVCHADTVLASPLYSYDDSTGIVTSAELDDRLGIAMLKWIMESSGLEALHLSDCAILICDNEECGQSSAKHFAADCKDLPNEFGKPNWLMEFDRRGTDAVTYQYDNGTWHSLLKSVGFSIGHGSFSDISLMESLGVSGVNVGVGYHSEHSIKCHANLNDTLTQLGRAEQFCADFKHLRLAHEIEPRFQSTYGRYNRYTASTQVSVKTSVSVSTLPTQPVYPKSWYASKYDSVFGSLPDDNPVDELDGIIIDDAEELDDDDTDDDFIHCESCDDVVNVDDMKRFAGQEICQYCYESFQNQLRNVLR